MLTTLSNSLIDGEQYWRDGDAKKSFKTYLAVGQLFEELQDYETASYFHQRCLEISVEFKYIEGQALAFKGLGICEEMVLNKGEAMQHLETALEKAVEGMLDSIARDISRDLVRVY
jgi:tetratricopeptide (TPR) repeat protein